MHYLKQSEGYHVCYLEIVRLNFLLQFKFFQSFFRRCKAEEIPGFPRFRGDGRYQSFCYPQSGFQSGFLSRGDELKLSKLGNLRVKLRRALEGEIKTCTLKRNASENWTVSFSCEIEMKLKEVNESAIGIDVGLERKPLSERTHHKYNLQIALSSSQSSKQDATF